MDTEITSEKVHYLYDKAGHRVEYCKEALQCANGDIDLALELLTRPHRTWPQNPYGIEARITKLEQQVERLTKKLKD